jgi:diguanylate cyclase (GGDEF)-like protein/PAS domain S-box-containing protein
LITFFVVGIAASVQITTLFDDFQIRYVVIPTIVATVVGTLLGYATNTRIKLSQSNEQFRAVVDIANEFIYYRNLDGEYQYVTPSCEQLTGYKQDVFYQTPHFMNSIIHEEDLQRWNNNILALDNEREPETLDVRIKTLSGETRWVKHLCAMVTDEKGHKIGLRASTIDITEQINHEHQIFNMAYYERLTALPNRRLFDKNLTTMIQKAELKGDVFSIFFIDLDRFKNINNIFGDNLGDKLLVHIAGMLQMSRESECFVYHLGGDKFVLKCSNIKDQNQANALGLKIIQKIEQAINIDDITIYTSASIGVAFYPRDGSKADVLVRNADTAMHKSKKDIANKVTFYQSEFSAETSHFIGTEQRIYKALINDEFIPYYQPKVEMSTGRIIGAEALVRWLTPEKKLISPGQFIDIAEETNQIAAISEQMTRKVLVNMNQWAEMNCQLPISINVSVRQIANNAYFSELLALLKSHNIHPNMLDIEVTEQLFLGDLMTAKQSLDRFRKAGFKIALDDFGTGYSSMSYLSDLNIDILKIDKSFIDHLASSKRSLSIIKAITVLSHDLNYEVIAEGVENEAQKDILLSLNCNIAQGYYFYRPMPEVEFTALLQQQPKKEYACTQSS